VGAGARMPPMARATEHLFFLTLFACANCHVAGVEGHLPWLDIACAFGIAWATAQLARAGGTTTVRAAMALMTLRWLSSVASLTLAPAASAETKRFALLVQLVAFATLACLG